MWRNEKYDRKLGQRLRIARETLGYAEAEAARIIGVTIRTWRRWEKGDGSTRWYGVVQEVAEEFDIRFGWLLNGRGQFLPHMEEEFVARTIAARGPVTDGGLYRPVQKH